MNPEKQLIFVNGQDKTESITSMRYTEDGKCQICFSGSQKV